MNNLDAQLKEISYINTSFEVKSVQSTKILLSDIANSVKQNPSDELKKSILTGMLFPVIVVSNTLEEYNKAVVGLSNALPYDESKKYLALIGNQRLTIAREYYDSIDAFIVDNGIECIFVKLAYEEQNGRRL